MITLQTYLNFLKCSVHVAFFSFITGMLLTHLSMERSFTEMQRRTFYRSFFYQKLYDPQTFLHYYQVKLIFISPLPHQVFFSCKFLYIIFLIFTYHVYPSVLNQMQYVRSNESLRHLLGISSWKSI